jgi:hypothetical protein
VMVVGPYLPFSIRISKPMIGFEMLRQLCGVGTQMRLGNDPKHDAQCHEGKA